METIKLYYFSVFAKTESVRKAADIINVSPSAISKALHQIEEELGVKLVTPLGRGVTLTEEGRKLALEANAILDRIALLKNYLKKEKKTKEESPLKIASFEVFSTYFLHALDKMGFENKSLVIHDLGPGEIERAVADGHVDFGISYLPSPHPNIEYLKISTIEMGVFKKKGTFKNWEQSKLPFVIPVYPIHGTPNRIRGLDGWPEDAYERKVQFEVTLMESALELCRQGRCAGYFPVFVVEEHNRKIRSEFHLERHPTPYEGRVCRFDVFLIKRKGFNEDLNMRLVAKMIRLGTKIGW